MPAWWLLDKERELVASVRAEDAHEAARIFRKHGLAGKWVRGPIWGQSPDHLSP